MRAVKVFAAAATGQFINVVSQLILPPLFFIAYKNGVEHYGEWITLSAAVSYLGTLNYGVQTYANNRMTFYLARGKRKQASLIQASAMLLLGVVIAVTCLLALIALFAPIAALFRLRTVSDSDAAFTLCLLILQIGASVALSFLANSFMGVGKLHVGSNLVNLQRLLSILGSAVIVAMGGPLAGVAAVQLLSVVIMTCVVFAVLKVTEPALVPSPRIGSWRIARSMLRPSLGFGIIASAGFLTWQAPLLITQLILGPAAVTLFSLSRSIFQMSRQILAMISNSIAQDISLIVGQSGGRALLSLYSRSEAVILALTPAASFGALVGTPFLVSAWLHNRIPFDLPLCVALAIVSAILGLKEHKTQFQSSSNEHERLAVVILIGYILTCIAGAGALSIAGVLGYVVVWGVWELGQTIFVLRLNHALLQSTRPWSAMRPSWRGIAYFLAASASGVFVARFVDRTATDSLVAACIYVGITVPLGVRLYGVSASVGRLLGRKRRVTQ